VSALVVSRPPFALSPAEAAGFATGTLALAVLMTASGAFNTDQFALPHRFALWALVALLTVGQTLALDALFCARLRSRSIARASVAGLAVLGVIGLMTFELHALKFTPLLPYEPDPLLEFALFLAPPIGAIGAVVALQRVLSSPERAAPPMRAPARLAFQSRIAGYLPPPPRARLAAPRRATRARA